MRKKIHTTTKNKNPYWKCYLKIKKRIDLTQNKLLKDLNSKNINLEEIQKDSSNLLFLLGECNYFAIECRHCQKKGKWG
jgi:hypothetical protein